MINVGSPDMGWTRWVPQLVAVAVLLVQGVIVWVLWSLKKEFVRKDDFDQDIGALNDKVVAVQTAVKGAVRKDDCGKCSASMNSKIVAIEAELSRLPSAESWASMQVAIEEVRGSNRALVAKIEGQGELLKKIEHPLQLLMEYHIIKGREG